MMKAAKRDLIFNPRLMNAAGTLGFAPESRLPLKWAELGAFVTNPLSLRPRLPAAEPALVPYPGGFLLHSGLPNPGFSAALKQYAAKWARSTLPIIVHLMADRPDETARMARRLETVENVAAVELGFAPLLADDLILLAVELAIGELPLIVNLPPEQVLRLGPRVIDLGAAAVSLAAPRGRLPGSGESLGNGRPVTGRLFGPALFAQALLMAHEAQRAGIPLIGGGGVYSKEALCALLEAGVLAVQVDAVLWRGDFIPA